MAWDRLPASDGNSVTLPAWNELIAAANERNAATLKAAALPEISGEVLRVPHVTTLRSRVEALIPYFYSPSTGQPWSKAACLTAAIGKSNWTMPVPSHKKAIRAPLLNDIKQVLDQLCWVKSSASAKMGHLRAGLGRDPDWDVAWAEAKAQYAASPFVDWEYADYAGLAVVGSIDGADKLDNILHHKLKTATFVIPSYGVAVAGTRLIFITGADAFADDGYFDVYEQASYAGAAVEVLVPNGTPASSNFAADLSVHAGGSTFYVSYATRESQFAGAVLDLYRPVGAAVKDRTLRLVSFSGTPALYSKLGFTYLDA